MANQIRKVIIKTRMQHMIAVEAILALAAMSYPWTGAQRFKQPRWFCQIQEFLTPEHTEL
jgi:hypothetical protein